MAFIVVVIVFGVAALLLAPRANLGDLVVSVAANIAPFKKGIEEAQSATKSFAGSFTSLLPVGGPFALIGGAIAETITASERGAEKIREISRASERLGIDPENFVAFNKVSKDTEGMTTSLRHLNIALGEVSLGSKTAEQAFLKFGLDGRELAGMKVDEAVLAIADRYKELASPAERAALAHDAFGKSGQALIPILEKGADGMREMAKHAKETGEAFSKIDAQKVEEAIKAMNRLRGEGFTVGREESAAVAFAPFKAAGANTLADAREGIQNAAKINIGPGMQGSDLASSLPVIGSIVQLYQTWAGTHDVIKGKADEIRKGADERAAAEVRVKEQVEAQNRAIELQRRALADRWAEFEKMAAGGTKDAEGLAKQWRDQAQAIRMGAEEAKLFNAALNAADPKKVAEAARELRDLKDVRAGQDAKKVIEGLMNPIEKMQAEAKRLQGLVDVGKLTEAQKAMALGAEFNKLPDMRQQYRPLGAVEAGSSAAASLEAKLKFEAQQGERGDDVPGAIEKLRDLFERKMDKLIEQGRNVERAIDDNAPQAAGI